MGCKGSQVRILSPRPIQSNTYDSGTVTFNYDTLIERAMAAINCRFTGLPDFIADQRFMPFKHGSVTWTRKVESTPWAKSVERAKIASEVISNAASLTISSQFQVDGQTPPMAFDSDAAIPAIAIPVESKTLALGLGMALGWVTVPLADAVPDRFVVLLWRHFPGSQFEWIVAAMFVSPFFRYFLAGMFLGGGSFDLSCLGRSPNVFEWR